MKLESIHTHKHSHTNTCTQTLTHTHTHTQTLTHAHAHTEAEASDSSESSSEEEVPINKPKVLQTRRSILDNLSEVSKQIEEPPAKRPKRDEDNEVGVASRSRGHRVGVVS